MKILPDKFVGGVSELRIYLSGEEMKRKAVHFFSLAQPLARQRDLLADQADPEPTEIEVSTGVEDLRPATRNRR